MWIDFVILGLSILFIFTMFYVSMFVHAMMLLVQYRMQDAPSYKGTGKRVLVIGDSTAIGCGATHSVPYWLHHTTGWTVDVVARSGATVMYVDKHWPKKKYDHYVLGPKSEGGDDRTSPRTFMCCNRSASTAGSKHWDDCIRRRSELRRSRDASKRTSFSDAAFKSNFVV